MSALLFFDWFQQRCTTSPHHFVLIKFYPPTLQAANRGCKKDLLAIDRYQNLQVTVYQNLNITKQASLEITTCTLATDAIWNGITRGGGYPSRGGRQRAPGAPSRTAATPRNPS